jgi:hypothetical protein
MTIVKLEFHNAVHTNASTTWLINIGDRLISLREARENGIIALVYSTKSFNKTHWVEYYQVLQSFDALVKLRVSNRSNINYTFYYDWRDRFVLTKEEEKILEVVKND